MRSICKIDDDYVSENLRGAYKKGPQDLIVASPPVSFRCVQNATRDRKTFLTGSLYVYATAPAATTNTVTSSYNVCDGGSSGLAQGLMRIISNPSAKEEKKKLYTRVRSRLYTFVRSTTIRIRSYLYIYYLFSARAHLLRENVNIWFFFFSQIYRNNDKT